MYGGMANGEWRINEKRGDGLSMLDVMHDFDVWSFGENLE
jgi:hypothetical protein